MRVLVTGGAGFIGWHFVRMLLDENASVTVLDRLTYAASLSKLEAMRRDERVRFVQGDIRDAGLLRHLVPGQDAVVNFAAETHVDRSIDQAAPFIQANVVGTEVLMEACMRAGTTRVIHVSTDEVYGSVAVGSCREDALIDPSSPYAASKAGGDMIALAYARTHNLNVTVTRCSNNYGPYQFPEKLIPRFVTRLLSGQVVPLYGDGQHVRDWLHVSDHCRGIRLVLDKGEAGEVYHVSGGAEITNKALVERLLTALGVDWDRVQNVPDRKGHDRRYSLDDTKLRNLGYRPLVNFEEGLAQTIRWYSEHRDWWEPLMTRAESDLVSEQR